MRSLYELNRFRETGKWVIDFYGNVGDDKAGVFSMASKSVMGDMIRIIASAGEGWDHVSVSLQSRCPTWEEMEDVKRTFFKADETAMQLHVPADDHINVMPYCLHLWRPTDREIPRPPGWMVGSK